MGMKLGIRNQKVRRRNAFELFRGDLGGDRAGWTEGVWSCGGG